MLVFQARCRVKDSETEALLGEKARPEHMPVVIHGEAAVYKPNGSLLCMVLPKAIPADLQAAAYPFLHRASNMLTSNRGTYAGREEIEKLRADPKKSKTPAPPTRSAIAGYMDRYPRMPYCRTCAVTADHPEEWQAAIPMVQHVASVFKKHAAKAYASQESVANKTHPAYVIPGTPFTTLTINGTVAGAYHTDKGDYHAGMGVISVHRKGAYAGAYLGFPGYGVCADLQDGDVILFDPHEIHGVTPFVAEGEPHVDYERISVVYYFREKMVNCLSPAEELERAKAVRGGLDTFAGDASNGEEPHVE